MNAESTGSLRKGCLNFTEVTSVAIALISPTMTAALIVPLMYSSAGNASWLAYLFGTVMLLFVALNLNQFARRSTSAGSMYAYTRDGSRHDRGRDFRMVPGVGVFVYRDRGYDRFHNLHQHAVRHDGISSPEPGDLCRVRGWLSGFSRTRTFSFRLF